ncbi:MAG TPA: hypothetical protein VF406_06815 [Thermodesulfobacteriota bacterium]
MTRTSDDETLAAFAAAVGAASLGEPDLNRLIATARQVREDARAVAALDLEDVEPEARPQVDLPTGGAES